MKRLLCAAIVSACLLGQTASAELFTVADNLSDYQLITAGTSLSGSFDINPVIPQNGHYPSPYNVTSAYYTFHFQDDGERTFSGGTTDTQYLYGYSTGSWWWRTYHSVYNRWNYNYYYDDYERVQVAVDGAYSTEGGTSWYQVDNLTGTSSETTYSGWSSYDHYYTYYYDRTQGYTGSLTLVQSLGQDALDSLSEDGVLDFTLTGLYGDLVYTGGTLTVDIPHAPVPGAVLLGLLGLGTAGMKLRRRLC